jgi:hypothetical protein
MIRHDGDIVDTAGVASFHADFESFRPWFHRIEGFIRSEASLPASDPTRDRLSAIHHELTTLSGSLRADNGPSRSLWAGRTRPAALIALVAVVAAVGILAATTHGDRVDATLVVTPEGRRAVEVACGQRVPSSLRGSVSESSLSADFIVVSVPSASCGGDRADVRIRSSEVVSLRTPQH